ncbi:ATP phosphoribosyltransferase, partial [Lactarius hengduanensis]
DASTLNDRLLFAIPKKGTSIGLSRRLHEKCLALPAGADIQFRRPNRLDVCLVQNPFVTVFLPASDIPSFVGKGNVDLGITGHDVILEAQMEAHVSETLRLGFGKCALQVQVPEAAPAHGVDALAGKRIVTSFEVLAGHFFADVDKRAGIGSDDARTQIEYVGGSVEAACALGLADGIDRMHAESGETMRAAGLRPIATLLQSEAVLIRSSTPKHAHLAPLIDKITARIAGVIAAGKYVICQYNVRRATLSAATTITPGRRAPTISPLEDPEWVAVSSESMVERSKMADVMDQLVSVGAEDILIFNLDNSRV